MKNIKLLLIASVILCGAVQATAQGIGYIGQRVTLFQNLPVHADDIVFIGNSLTDGAEWCELFPGYSIKNRGISGDTTDGVLKRMANITDGHPAKIFLLIGINDFARKQTPEEVAADLGKILEYITLFSPDTKVYVQSILPVNDFAHNFTGITARWKEVPAFNELYRAVAADNGATFIDLYPHFVDENGKLDAKYTNDGLHLLGNGYLHWAEILRPYIEE